LRRLHRLAQHYGAQPQYLLTSAPLANMAEVARTLTAQGCTVVSGEVRGTQPQSRVLLESQDDPVDLCCALLAYHQEVGLHPLILAPDSLVPRLRDQGMPQVFPHQTPVAAVRATTYQSLICLGLPAALAWLHDYLAWLASGSLPSLSLLLLKGQTPSERPISYVIRKCMGPPGGTSGALSQQSTPGTLSSPLCGGRARPGCWERYGGIHGVGELIHQLADTQVLTRHATSGTCGGAGARPTPTRPYVPMNPPVTVCQYLDGRPLIQMTPERGFR
jgi:hypothetical protein